MQKMVIADDDEILLQGLTDVFPWGKYGIRVVAGVTDGESALREVERCQADILLTDIRMPKLDGLELASRIRERKLDTTVIIMSAYDDFQYAHKAIRLDVKDYLVKPVDLSLLEETVLKVISLRNEKKKQEESISSLIEQNKNFMEETILMELIAGEDMFLKDPKRVNGLLSETDPDCVWMLLEICIERAVNERELKEQFQELSVSYGWKWIGLNVGRNIVCCFDAEERLSERVREFREQCRDCLDYMEPDAGICFLMGTSVNEIRSLNLSYQCIEELKKYLYIHTGRRDLDESDLERLNNKHHKINTFVMECLADMVLKGQDEKIRLYVDKLYDNLKNAGGDSQIMFSYALSLFMIEMQNKMKELHIDPQLIQQDYDFWYKDIITKGKLSEGIYLFRQMVIHMGDRICAERNVSEVGILKKAKLYIDGHFTDPALRMSEVAEYVGISNNYFSTLFKKQAQMSFSEYVMERRVEEAKKLIAHQDLRSSEAAMRVGFDSPNYFSTIFKKYTGVTVSQYRRGNADL